MDTKALLAMIPDAAPSGGASSADGADPDASPAEMKRACVGHTTLVAAGVPAAEEAALDPLLGLLSEHVAPEEPSDDEEEAEAEAEDAWLASFDAVAELRSNPAGAAKFSASLARGLIPAGLARGGFLERVAPTWAHTDGDTLLCATARTGVLGAVEALLAKGALPDMPNGAGATPLRLACAAGHLAVARALHKAGAALDGGPADDADDDAGRAPFFVACALGHENIARWLASVGGAAVADVTRADAAGRTPAMAAAARGHAGVVKYLIEDLAADANATTRRGVTATMFAAAHGHANVVRYLADAQRADVSARDRGGNDALALAAHANQLDAVRALAARGADVKAALAKRAAAPGADEAAKAPVWRWLHAVRDFPTPLHFIDALTQPEAHALLRAGADIEETRARGGDERGAVPSPRALACGARPFGAAWARHPTAALIRAAARPWSPRTHGLFPRAARAYAVELYVMGKQLARGGLKAKPESGETALKAPKLTSSNTAALGDVWTIVMEFSVTRLMS